ncbi:MAG: hypothetical protein BWK79_14915 [Beggiatoa sp. IS2]|nr:MAG: hypothetical protein BWK79_14915 [Beggiatoa sp. IS2]
MGIFNFAKTSSSTDTFTKQEAFLAVALAMSAADGEVVEDEVKGIFAYLLQMRMFDGYSQNQLSAVFKKLVKILSNEGVGGLVAVAKSSLPESLRESAFACAVDIALADGKIEDSERALLDELRGVLEVSENTAKMVIQVMEIKNRN